MHQLFSPARFTRIASAVLPYACAAAVLLTGAGLYLSLYASPPDYQQSEAVRIMYVHVPAAWMALFVYASMAAASAGAIVWKNPLAELYTKAVAPVGAGFTLICLATGSLWGAPMWGTWWAWDARLTSVLILFFLYLGYLALVNAFDEPGRGLKAGSILVLVGTVNLPIIKFSVDWWNTLHQPASVSRIGVPAVDPVMLMPLLVMTAAFMAIFLVLALVRTRTEIVERKIQAVRFRQAATGTARPASATADRPVSQPSA